MKEGRPKKKRTTEKKVGEDMKEVIVPKKNHANYLHRLLAQSHSFSSDPIN